MSYFVVELINWFCEKLLSFIINNKATDLLAQFSIQLLSEKGKTDFFQLIIKLRV